MTDVPAGGGDAASARRPSRFSRFVLALVSVLEVFCALMMVTMAIIVLLGVWYRYVVERALPWYDEFAEFLLVWLTFYGSVLASYRGAHIGFETLVEYFPAWLQRVAALVSVVVIMAVQAAMFYYGWLLVEGASFDTAISVRWVRLSWILSAIPISGGLMFLIGAQDLIRRLRWARP